MTEIPILTFEEAKALLRVNKNLLRKLLKTKQIPARKVGREWRIPRESIQKFMDAPHEKTRLEARRILG
jgi:excisionase family DNA binding protein